MARPAPTLQWTPGGKPQRVTDPKPRRKPAPGGPPAAPLPLGPLPPRVLPGTPGQSPAQPAPVTPTRPQSAAAAAAAPAAVTAAAHMAAGVPAHRRQALQAQLDLDDAEFAELHAAGHLLEVGVGSLRRYVLAGDLPDALRAEALVDGTAAVTTPAGVAA